MDVKAALKDSRFRDSLPIELQEDVASYLHNPGCACNVPFYRKLIKKHSKYLQKYYPGREVMMDEKDEIKKLAENNWTVINCKIFELESRLKQLVPGRKQLAISRYEDDVTIIVNEIDILW